MIEKFARGCINAVSAAAEIDAVEIKFEDLILRKFALHRKRQDDFAEFARPCLIVGEEDVARKLLRDR